MRAEKAVFNVLTTAAGLTALLGGGAAGIYPAQAPLGAVFPCVVYMIVSGIHLPMIDAFSQYGYVKTRVSVVGIGKTYADVKNVLDQVRQALDNARGTFNTVVVVSSTVDTIGPDLYDGDLQLFSQSIDFQITFREP